MNIRSRFAIAGVVATFVVLLASSGIVLRQTTVELRKNFDADLTARYEASAPLIASAPSIDRLIDTLSANSTQSGVRVVRDGSETRFGSMPVQIPDIPEKQLTTISTVSGTWRVYSSQLAADPSVSVQPVTVQMFAPTNSLDSRIHLIRRRVGLVLIGALFAAAAISWIIGGYATKPLRRLAKSVSDYKAETPVVIPVDQGVDEVDALGVTINDLLQQQRREHDVTRKALTTAREFSWNAVHELRTPLMSMRTDTDTLVTHPELDQATRAALLDNISRQQARVNATLTALHDLARSDLRTADTFHTFDLSEIIETLIDGLRSVHPNATIDMALPEHCMVKGWSEGLDIAIRNLITNAINHGGSRVAVEIREDGEQIVVTIDDNGPGVPEVDRTRIFERFERGTSSGPGTGLGLALVKQQAELHGGSVGVDASPSLDGSRFTLRITR